MKGSLIIVSFFVLGTLVGLFNIIPFDFAESDLSYYALCALMFFVGLNVGSDSKTLKSFRTMDPRILLLPLVTIIGTLIGSALI